MIQRYTRKQTCTTKISPKAITLSLFLPLLLVLTQSTTLLVLAETDYTCDISADYPSSGSAQCPSIQNGVCENPNLVSGGDEACRGADCIDCNTFCEAFAADCYGCLNAKGCYYCPEDGNCQNSDRYNFGSKNSACTSSSNNYLSQVLGHTADSCISDASITQDPSSIGSNWAYEMIKIQEVWNTYGLTGNGVTIRINDDGVYVDNVEFDGRFDDVSNSCPSYMPQKTNGGDYEVHGTRVAGILLGNANNNACAAGIAYNAKFSSCDFFAKDMFQTTMFLHKLETYDISQNSIGIPACYDADSDLEYFQDVVYGSECPFTYTPDNADGFVSPCSVCSNFNVRPLNSVCQDQIKRHCKFYFKQDQAACMDFPELVVGEPCSYNKVSSSLMNAIEKGITEGRNGKGIIYTFASGNSYFEGEDVNFSDWTNSRFTITVGAVGKDGLHTDYSTGGAAVTVVAPSKDYSDIGSLMTAGIGRDTCSDSGVGTSFACPVVSGVIALMLEANPELSWRDVQGILAETSQNVFNDDQDVSDVTNGAGFWHSNWYGWGIIDAKAAVDAALNWDLFSEELQIIGISPMEMAVLSDEPMNRFQSYIDLDPTDDAYPSDFVAESTVVLIDLSHYNRGDLLIQLESPLGTLSTLHPGKIPEDTQTTQGQQWKLMTLKNWNESPTGRWTLTIRDLVDRNGIGDDSNVFRDWTIVVYGRSSSGQSAPVMAPVSPATNPPTKAPTMLATGNPTKGPTINPTLNPTKAPSNISTMVPTISPTKNLSSDNPTPNPTNEASFNPSQKPTNETTKDPTKMPSMNPTIGPTYAPSKEPTREPTRDPTREPTAGPTVQPTKNPTRKPSIKPTDSSTREPTQDPTMNPTVRPTGQPTIGPTAPPTREPTRNPSSIIELESISISNGESMSCEAALMIENSFTVIEGIIHSSISDALDGSCLTGLETMGGWYQIIGNGKIFTLAACSLDASKNVGISIFSGACSKLECIEHHSRQVADCESGNGFAISFQSEPRKSYKVLVSGLPLGIETFTDFTDAAVDSLSVRRKLQSLPKNDFQLKFTEEIAPQNSKCGSSLPVGFESPVKGSTVGLLTTYKTCENTEKSGAWYTVQGGEPTEDGDIAYSANTCDPDSNFYNAISVYSGSGCGSHSCVDVNVLPCPNGSYGQQVFWTSTEQEEFQIFVHSSDIIEAKTFNAGTFLMDITFDNRVPNDFCSAAVDIELVADKADLKRVGRVEGRTKGSIPDVESIKNASCGLGDAGSWHRITGTGAVLQASTCSNITDHETVLHVYSGECEQLTCIDSGGADLALCENENASLVNFRTQVGTDYYILVTSREGKAGNFELEVTEIHSPYNNECSVGIVLEDDTILGSTVEATIDFPIGYNCGVPLDTPGVWYELKGTGKGIEISTCQTNDFESAISVFHASLSGVNIYQDPMPDNSCDNLKCVSGTSAIDPKCSDGNGVAVSFFGEKNTKYQVYVHGKSGASKSVGDFSLSYNEFEILERNEFCPSARNLPIDGSRIRVSTGDASRASVPYSSCGVEITSPGFWYTFQGNGQPFNVMACNEYAGGTDASVSIFESDRGGCDSLTCLTGTTFNDNVCSSAQQQRFLQGEMSSSAIRFMTQPGREYYVFVHGEDGVGDFELLVQDESNIVPIESTRSPTLQPTKVIRPPKPLSPKPISKAPTISPISQSEVANIMGTLNQNSTTITNDKAEGGKKGQTLLWLLLLLLLPLGAWPLYKLYHKRKQGDLNGDEGNDSDDEIAAFTDDKFGHDNENGSLINRDDESDSDSDEWEVEVESDSEDSSDSGDKYTDDDDDDESRDWESNEAGVSFYHDEEDGMHGSATEESLSIGML